MITLAEGAVIMLEEYNYINITKLHQCSKIMVL